MPESSNQLTGLKKRQQIASANKMIFVWVIVASVAIAFCAVTMQFLIRQAIFNQKIIGAKLETQGTLSKNIENVNKLKQNVDALEADTRLASVKANPEDTNLKVVLDALPTTDDRTALGASLQQVILPKSGVDVSGLTTISAGGETAIAFEGAEAEAPTIPTADFSFDATGSYDSVKVVLGDLERTIRPMNVQKLALQSADGQIKATVEGVSYYSPQVTVKLGKKTIKP